MKIEIEIKESQYGYIVKEGGKELIIDGGFISRKDNLPALCRHICEPIIKRCYFKLADISPVRAEIKITLSGMEHMEPSEMRQTYEEPK